MINARYQYIYQSKNTARAMLFDGTWLRFGYNRERAEALTSTTCMLALNFISVKVIHSPIQSLKNIKKIREEIEKR